MTYETICKRLCARLCDTYHLRKKDEPGFEYFTISLQKCVLVCMCKGGLCFYGCFLTQSTLFFFSWLTPVCWYLFFPEVPLLWYSYNIPLELLLLYLTWFIAILYMSISKNRLSYLNSGTVSYWYFQNTL